MISKQYRLNEKEVRKVLQRKKPFFSYGLIANTIPNTLGHNRCAILLSGKQAKGSVNRNFFRRELYNISREYITASSLDVVFVAKKGTVFDHKNPKQHAEFICDIHFLWKLMNKKKDPK